jgi:pimeloyl-ACP methyl ester carboxylesterase
MKRKICAALVLLLCFALCMGGLAEAAPQPNQGDPGQTYSHFVDQALAQAGCSIQNQISRKQLAGDIYEYSAILKVGPGPYDKIGLHRVVAEKAPWIPATARNAVMMIHGDSCNFDMAFATPNSSQESLAIYLAQQGVDVWGIDLRWAVPGNIPDTTANFSFMKNWNTAVYLQDIGTAIRICRAVRLLTGDGPDKVILLGHSRGAQLVYSYANQEAVLPEAAQTVKAIIPIDVAYKLNLKDHPNDLVAQAIEQGARTRYGTLTGLYASGTYDTNGGATLKGLAYLAATAPSVHSQIPGMTNLTNLQVALGALTATYASATPQMPAATPFFHYLAGTFDPQAQAPLGLQFAGSNYVVGIGEETPSFQSIGEQIDGEAILSNVPNPYDNHLAQIKIPVFYVGAGGGFGQYGADTLTFLGSKDKKSLIVSTCPGIPIIDYGHADLLWSSNAENLAWQPIARWIVTH